MSGGVVVFPAGGPGRIRSARQVPELRNWMIRQWAPRGLFTEVTGAVHRNSPNAVYAEAAPNRGGFGSADLDLALDSSGAREALRRATLYYVEAPMVDLLATVAPSAPTDVRPTDLALPCDEGLMVFAKPVMGTASDHGLPVEVHAVTWHLSKLPGKVDALSVDSYRQGWPLTDQPPDVSAAMEQVWFPMGRSDWPTADTLGTRPSWAGTEAMWQSFLEDRRLVVSIFTLLGEQGLTSQLIERAERHVAKRASREGVTAASSVVVANLRAPRYEPAAEPSDSPTRRTHRWLVREHLRWQACGPGRAERRLTVVRAHVRGPADAPLVVKDKVNRWVR